METGHVEAFSGQVGELAANGGVVAENVDRPWTRRLGWTSETHATECAVVEENGKRDGFVEDLVAAANVHRDVAAIASI